MEAGGAKILYQHLIKSRGLQYISYIGDADSKAYIAV